jgi:hypothetical protein
MATWSGHKSCYVMIYKGSNYEEEDTSLDAKLDLLPIGTITLPEVSYSITIPISILQLHWGQHPNRWDTCKGSNTWNASRKMDFDTWCIG